MSPAADVVRSPDFRAFSNQLKGLRFIDLADLEDCGGLRDGDWPAFRDAPADFFQHASDHDAAVIWTALQAKQARVRRAA